MLEEGLITKKTLEGVPDPKSVTFPKMIVFEDVLL